MAEATDLTGKKFGQWTVLERLPNSPSGHLRWKCRCSCGNEAVVYGSNLIQGSSRQCLRCRNASYRG